MDDDFKIPVRTELTVIPGDPPGTKPLGFSVFEYNGVPITRSLGTVEPITGPLEIGETIFVPAMFTPGGYHQMVVTEGNDSYERKAKAESGLVALLEFAKDPRQIWTAVGLVAPGIKKWSLARDDE